MVYGDMTSPRQARVLVWWKFDPAISIRQGEFLFFGLIEIDMVALDAIINNPS